MAKIQFFLHSEVSGYASRKDLAVVEDGKIIRVFTVGVTNGNTTGSGFRPFKKGENIRSAVDAVERFNRIPEGAACICGATEEYHTRSAACYDRSELREIGAHETAFLAVEAKRREVGEAILNLLRRLYRWGEV